MCHPFFIHRPEQQLPDVLTFEVCEYNRLAKGVCLAHTSTPHVGFLFHLPPSATPYCTSSGIPFTAGRCQLTNASTCWSLVRPFLHTGPSPTSRLVSPTLLTLLLPHRRTSRGVLALHEYHRVEQTARGGPQRDEWWADGAPHPQAWGRDEWESCVRVCRRAPTAAGCACAVVVAALWHALSRDVCAFAAAALIAPEAWVQRWCA